MRRDGRAYVAGRGADSERLRVVTLDARGRPLRGFAMSPYATYYRLLLAARPGEYDPARR